MMSLQRNNNLQLTGPLVFVILDGMGIGPPNEGNAFYHARTPNLDRLMQLCPYTELKAHGTSVGLPSDKDMGNSEVGHNAIGAGRVVDQGAKLVSNAIESREIFRTKLWGRLIEGPAKGKPTIHFIGLLSDGNVHSHIDHLLKIIEQCAKDGVKKLKVHTLLDGRDVPETSSLLYIDRLEEHLHKFREQGLDYAIASGGGRMIVTMDRYEADWEIVKRGWEAHVIGSARQFGSASEAVKTFRSENKDISDQNLPAFTIVKNGKPVGTIEDGDSVVYFNFRGDRAIEISRAFTEKDFNKFERKRFPRVVYAGVMEYDGDLKIPENYLVPPPSIDRTLSEYLAAEGIRQYAISETQKFGHVTYFWNGNRSGKFDEKLETYVEIPSDRIEFDLRPWMKAAEITDTTIEAIKSGKYDFIRLNYANGDMVGHTGNLDAAIIAAETVDLCLGRLLGSVEKEGGCAIITADHGNLDEMYDIDKAGNIKTDKKTGERIKKTSHTLNPVPFIVFHPGTKKKYKIHFDPENRPGLGNIGATILLLLGFKAPEFYFPSILSIL